MSSDNKKNPYAAALKYDGENAPKLVAKGSGTIAEKIVASAEEHGVHVHSDPLLAGVLSKLELGDEIPKELYLAVAKIIAFAYFLQGKHPDYRKTTASQTSPDIFLADQAQKGQLGQSTDLLMDENKDAEHFRS